MVLVMAGGSEAAAASDPLPGVQQHPRVHPVRPGRHGGELAVAPPGGSHVRLADSQVLPTVVAVRRGPRLLEVVRAFQPQPQ